MAHTQHENRRRHSRGRSRVHAFDFR
jgi:hypothetical protein